MIITLTQLNYVVAVDTHRHFGRAARSCFVSQPTLSMQLQKLEDHLGVVIFDRSRQPIVPTEKGLEIVTRAKQILSEVRKLEYIGKKQGTEPEGKFTLGIIPTLAPYILPLFLPEFSSKYPKVDLYINEMKTEDIITALEEDKIDAGLLATPLERPTIKERVLFYEPFYFFVSPKLPQFQKSHIKPSDLDENQIWLLEEGHCFRNQVLQLCSSTKKKNILSNVHFESGTLETLKELVTHGSGYTLMPYLSIWKERNPKIKEMIKPFSKPAPSREISLVYVRDQLKIDVLDALAKMIDQTVPKILPRTAKGLEVLDI